MTTFIDFLKIVLFAAIGLPILIMRLVIQLALTIVIGLPIALLCMLFTWVRGIFGRQPKDDH